MATHVGRVFGVNGNLVTAEFDSPVVQNEVGYVQVDDLRLRAEVIRIRGRFAELQVFEDTTGARAGNEVQFTSELMTAELGPGLLGQIFDGLQNPLPDVAQQCGFFLQRGVYLRALNRDRRWAFVPAVKTGATVAAGDALGSVPEGVLRHQVMVPFNLHGPQQVEWVAAATDLRLEDKVAVLVDGRGAKHDVTMLQRWPVKLPIRCYAERLRPVDPLVTKVRIIDTFFPVARGGTYCIPGPFGAGKTVLQQITSRHADVDVVIVAAVGERAGEVVETLREFPELIDPRTGKSLMERTLIVCNTSSMPVAAREASVYLAATVAEYYRQMGLHVLLLADSTSRWAQALREVSGRLEEIPGEEAFPAYLESVIASFYERAGVVRLNDGRIGSVTIGGTVSPAGGNFEEPVTQATLKVVGAFHGLSRERSDARRFPAIAPLDSWSKYDSVVPEDPVENARSVLRAGNDVKQMMKVIGEEGTSTDDFVVFLKAELIDAVYLQQDAYHDVDGASSAERQQYVFARLARFVETPLGFTGKDQARQWFQRLTQVFKDWNLQAQGSAEFAATEQRLEQMVKEVARR